MRRINCFLLTVFLLVPLLFLNNPAHAMPISQMETIVADARGAVDTALAQLQSALATNDQQTVQLAQQTLDLAVANYAIASESLEKAQAGETVSDSTMLACSNIAAGVNNVCSLIAAGSLADARSAYDTASTTYGSLPPPTNSAQIPAGLADIQGQILATFSESTSFLSGSAGASDRLGVSTDIASPI